MGLEADIPPGTPRVANSGEPVRFSNVQNLAGFAAEPAAAGAEVKIRYRGAFTSDSPMFHRLAESIAGVINHMAAQAGTDVRLERANCVLLVLKSDSTAELWVDTAAVSLECRLRRSVQAGSAIFHKDIADITAMSFPYVRFEETDKVLCLFRKDWRFGLAFDFNPERKLDLKAFRGNLGTLYRELAYSHLYSAIRDSELFDRLVSAGWFPFAEIIAAEFVDLTRHCESGLDLAELEQTILKSFDSDRVDRILERWETKPHFSAKSDLFKEAFEAFKEQRPVAVIKILLTEIEGVLNEAHRAQHGNGAKLEKLLKFAESSAKQRAGGENTLMFPSAFGRYLRSHIFSSSDARIQNGTASSRHAVGHGAAAPESYTMVRALQAILTLDQLAFYT